MALPRDELLALIERIKEQDIEVKAWRAFPDENALNCPPNGEFQNATGPLSGLTVGVKDIIDVAGIPTRHGSRIYENALPALADAQCVTLMRAAGATIVGKTVTTELATFVPSVTRNPRNLDHTPGGSSSGSAAAVAAGHVDIAIGTQTAGSIIRPAAYCGVFGFKPSFGLAPRGGVKIQSETLDTVGVFARSIEHCEAWLSSVTQQPGIEAQSDRPSEAALRIAIITNLLDLASEEMRDAFRRAKTLLIGCGHEVAELTLPRPLANAQDLQATIQSYEVARAYLPESETHPSNITPALLEALSSGRAISDDEYANAVALSLQTRKAAGQWFVGYDAWLMPSASGSAPLDLASTGDPLFNRLASILGLPALNLTGILNKQGLPLGMQLLGPFGDDQRLLQHAKRIAPTIRLA